MSDTKYGKHLTTDCVHMGKAGTIVSSTRHLESFGGGNFSLDCIHIKAPKLMIKQPHQHEFDQYLCFFSANPDDPADFDAEIELSLGEESEKQIITRPTVAHVPAGLYHGPLNFARINKPVMFVDVAITGKYGRVGNTAD